MANKLDEHFNLKIDRYNSFTRPPASEFSKMYYRQPCLFIDGSDMFDKKSLAAIMLLCDPSRLAGLPETARLESDSISQLVMERGLLRSTGVVTKVRFAHAHSFVHFVI